MSDKGNARELIWVVAGGLGLMVAFFTMLYVRGDPDPAALIAFKEKRLALVNAMRLSLAAASEAQNSAVMSTSDKDTKAFADQARIATTALERGQIELNKLLKENGDSNEAELMNRFDQALREFQQIDKQLLDLAVQNSNRKANDLAFRPAMTLLKQMDEALSRVVAEHAESPAENGLRAVQLASDIRIGILRMQVLLLPHIAEPSDQKMDELEAQLSAEDRNVRENFAALSAQLPQSEQADLETATSRYADFDKLKSEIITLSRQNTDLRAVAIALQEKRLAMLACQDALVEIEHAIRAEPISSTIPSGRSTE
jgi:hypothetical protein